MKETLRNESKSTRAIIERNRKYFKELLGHNFIVSKYEAKDNDGFKSVGWSFILDPEKHTRRQHMSRAQRGGVEMFLDFDETQAPTAANKSKFNDDCATLLPKRGLSEEEVLQQAEDFKKAAKLINRVARVLPERGEGKERYAPLLELRGVSRLLYYKYNIPEYQFPVTEAEARELISMEVHTDAIDNKGKDRWPDVPVYITTDNYVEHSENEVGIHYGESAPTGVYPPVWERFKRNMLNSTVEDDELDNFDAPSEVWITTLTFGPLDYQLAKTKEAVSKLKKAGKRIPDEIFVVTEGLKYPLILQRMNEFPDKKFVFVDDIVDWLSPLSEMDRMTVVHANRPGSVNADIELPSGIFRVPIKDTKHSQILKKLKT